MLTSVAIREMEMKTTMRNHFATTRLAPPTKYYDAKCSKECMNMIPFTLLEKFSFIENNSVL